jgi:DNA mismatch endonuclease (patch repair protein)
VERFLSRKLPGGRFVAVSEVRSRTMRAIRGKHNRSTEGALRMALISAGIKGWTLHPSGLHGNPDIIFPGLGLAIFVDGCFWHGCSRCGHTPRTRTAFWRAKISRNRRRDRRNTNALRKQGLIVIRVWEHALAGTQRTRRVVERIRAAISQAEK